MSEPLASRHEQMLGEFAEWLHASAREAQRRLMESESADDFATYNNALHKLGRNLRQTLALHKRFQDGRLDEDLQAAHEAEAAAAGPGERKRARVRRVLERLVWDEHERDEDEDGPGERLLAEIDDRLEALGDEPAFMETPDDVLIARLCEAFDLPVPPHIAQAEAILAQAAAPRPAGNGHDSS